MQSAERARAVLIGRPYLWGLAVDGEAGVARVLAQPRHEVVLAVALCGRQRVADLDPALVAAKSSRSVTSAAVRP